LAVHDLEVGDGSISFRVEPHGSEDLHIRILEQQGGAITLRDGRTGRPLY
jgi:hypothetical protein